jgi:hypothetical protein
MWPWEHLAIGYLAYSLWRRIDGPGRPSTGEALVVAFATQFPDLIDKPLGWGTTILPAGTSLAHSALVALPTALAVQALAMAAGRRRLGTAFAVGYLTHLPGDVLYPVLLGGSPKLAFLLWPLVPAAAHPPVSLLAQVGDLVNRFLEIMGTPRGRTYVLLEASLLAAALAAWLLDGRPGLDLLRRRPAES